MEFGWKAKGSGDGKDGKYHLRGKDRGDGRSSSRRYRLLLLPHLTLLLQRILIRFRFEDAVTAAAAGGHAELAPQNLGGRGGGNGLAALSGIVDVSFVIHRYVLALGARTVQPSMARFLIRVAQVIVCGGGYATPRSCSSCSRCATVQSCPEPFIIICVKYSYPAHSFFSSSESIGVDPQAVEAMAFAWLAHAHCTLTPCAAVDRSASVSLCSTAVCRATCQQSLAHLALAFWVACIQSKNCQSARSC